MSENKENKTAVQVIPNEPIPANIPDELLPVYEWYKTKGREHITAFAVGLLVVVAVLSFVRFRENQNVEAATLAFQADDAATLEDVNGRFGKSIVGPVIGLRLAKAYYDESRFSDAANAYSDFIKRNAKHILLPQAQLGYAASLEADQQFDAAQAEYQALSVDVSAPTYSDAMLGKARCIAAAGNKDAAYVVLDELIAAVPGMKDAADELRGVIKRFNGFKDTSLFDRMNAVGADDAAPAVSQAAPEKPAEPVAEPEK